MGRAFRVGAPQAAIRAAAPVFYDGPAYARERPLPGDGLAMVDRPL